MRIGLIGDSHGFVPALAAGLAACRAEGVDVIVHSGDILTAPFSPDEPGESIELLGEADVPTVYGNHDAYLRAWGAPEWRGLLRLRAASRPGAPGAWVDRLAEGQARLTAAELGWLRVLPAELVIAPGVFACHGMPGNPFLSFWDPRGTIEERERALLILAETGVDLLLLGHHHEPRLEQLGLPDGRQILAVRPGAVCGWGRGDEPAGTIPRAFGGHAIVDRTVGGWQARLGTFEWRPRDPTWSWERSLGIGDRSR